MAAYSGRFAFATIRGTNIARLISSYCCTSATCCVYLCYGPVTRSLPWGDLVDRLQSFSFHHLCYPNYGALTPTPAVLSPAEHASLRWTHNIACGFTALRSS